MPTQYEANAQLSSQVASLIGRVSQKLMACGTMLATAESCTGGLAAAHCTEVSGSSGWFVGGVVAYANGVKEQVLGVPGAVLAGHGAVSGPVVEAMARGVCRVTGAEVGVAVSGVAGPTGGSVEKPVGTVWVAAVMAGEQERVLVQRFVFAGNRGQVREQAVQAMLEMVEAVLE